MGSTFQNNHRDLRNRLLPCSGLTLPQLATPREPPFIRMTLTGQRYSIHSICAQDQLLVFSLTNVTLSPTQYLWTLSHEYGPSTSSAPHHRPYNKTTSQFEFSQPQLHHRSTAIMSWLKTVLLNLRTAFSAAPKPGGPRSIEAAIRTAARKTLAQEPSKLMNSPKRLTTSPRKLPRPGRVRLLLGPKTRSN